MGVNSSSLYGHFNRITVLSIKKVLHEHGNKRLSDCVNYHKPLDNLFHIHNVRFPINFGKGSRVLKVF